MRMGWWDVSVFCYMWDVSMFCYMWDVSCFVTCEMSPCFVACEMSPCFATYEMSPCFMNVRCLLFCYMWVVSVFYEYEMSLCFVTCEMSLVLLHVRCLCILWMWGFSLSLTMLLCVYNFQKQGGGTWRGREMCFCNSAKGKKPQHKHTPDVRWMRWDAMRWDEIQGRGFFFSGFIRPTRDTESPGRRVRHSRDV